MGIHGIAYFALRKSTMLKQREVIGMNELLMTGKWVRQYQKGIWKVVDIKPKIAFEDYCGEELSWKKGDLIGYWALLIRAFNSKMSFSLGSDYCDLSWCRLVSDEEKQYVENFFRQNEPQRKRLEQYVFRPTASLYNIWVNIPESMQDYSNEHIDNTAFPIGINEFMSGFKCKGIELSSPPTTHLLNLHYFPWDVDEAGNLSISSAELIKVTLLFRWLQYDYKTNQMSRSTNWHYC